MRLIGSLLALEVGRRVAPAALGGRSGGPVSGLLHHYRGHDLYRLSPAIDVRQSYRGLDVVDTLERASRAVGYPKTIRLDNGPEFISRELDLWAFMKGVTLDFSRPGKPTDNAFIESLNGKFRAECLNANWFQSLDEARQKNARLGVETTIRCVRTAPLATEYRQSFILRLATPASQPSDEAGIYQPTWSKVGGKFTT